MQHLVTELKRDRDEDFQNSIDELASELNRVSMTASIYFLSWTASILVYVIVGFAYRVVCAEIYRCLFACFRQSSAKNTNLTTQLWSKELSI
jgi:hypothetical protein